MTITQTEAIELLATDLDYVDTYDTLTDYDNFSPYHQQMFDKYLGLSLARRKSLKQLDNIFVNLLGYIKSNIHRLDLTKDYGYLLTLTIEYVQNLKRCPIHLRVCLYQLLAMSVKLELLANIYEKSLDRSDKLS